MSKNLLRVKDLCVSADGQRILNGVDLEIDQGTVHVLMGPNGAGKSTLATVVMGDPRFQVDAGRILFEGEDITDEKPDARARRGMFLSFQVPEEIPGITVEDFLRAAKAAYTGDDVRPSPFRKELHARMRELGMDLSHATRYLNGRVLGRRKKEKRDPADGGAQAKTRHIGRNRFRPGHRRGEKPYPRACAGTKAKRMQSSSSHTSPEYCNIFP